MPAADEIDAHVQRDEGEENKIDPFTLKMKVATDKETMKVRKPLGDRTNGTQKQRMKSSLASVEDANTKPIILSHEMTRGILESSQEDIDKLLETELPQVDADGFVIWDDASEAIDKDEEILKLKEALKEALEENHKLHVEVALNKVDQEELKSARNQLEMIAELYEMAKSEIEELKGK